MTPDETEHFALLRAERDRFAQDVADLRYQVGHLKVRLSETTKRAVAAEQRAEAEHEAAERMRSALWSVQITVDDVIEELGSERRRE